MAEKTSEKREKIVEITVRFAEKPLLEELERETVSRERFKKMTGMLAEAFEELAEPDGMMKYCLKRVQGWVREALEVDAVKKTGDPLLDKCVELIRDNLITKTERDSLAKHVSEELVEDWKRLSDEAKQRIGGDDGILADLTEKLEEESPDWKKIGAGILEALKLLAPRTLERVTDEQFDKLLDDGISILRKIEKKQSFWEPFLEWMRAGLAQIGVITIMRKSFTRLLLGDIILHSVGKGLGLKGKVTVTDFILLTGARVAEKTVLDESDGGDVARLIGELEELR